MSELEFIPRKEYVELEKELQTLKTKIWGLPEATSRLYEKGKWTNYGIDCKLAIDKLKTLIK